MQVRHVGPKTRVTLGMGERAGCTCISSIKLLDGCYCNHQPNHQTLIEQCVSFVIDASVFKELCSITSTNATGGSAVSSSASIPQLMLHIFECDDCDQSFDSQQALDQHFSSLAHAPLYKCDDCDRWFDSPQSL
jgi:Zinc-finger double-stranded RNA-binding